MAGLYVVEQAADFAAIDRDLRRLDDRLSLTFEIDQRSQRRVYQVLCAYAGDHTAVLCEWRDEWGYPLPLSSGLLEQVASQRPRDGLTDFTVENEARKSREIDEFEQTVDEIAADMGPRIAGRRSAALPRGQHLRRSRDQRRARGESA